MAERQNLEKLLNSVGVKCTDPATTQFIDSSIQKQFNSIISRAIKRFLNIHDPQIRQCDASKLLEVIGAET